MYYIVIAGVLATATVTADSDSSSVVIRLQATVEAPLEVTVLNDSELDALDQPAPPVRVFRDLNTGVVRTTPVASLTSQALL